MPLKSAFAVIVLWAYLLAPRMSVGAEVNLGIVVAIFAVALAILSPQTPFLPQGAIENVAQNAFLFLACGAYFFGMALLTQGGQSFEFTKIAVFAALYPIISFILLRFLKPEETCGTQVLDWTLKTVVLIVSFNSIIIVGEYLNADLRGLIEGMLVQVSDNNIDYLTHPFRLRGIAAGGGAGLSVMNALAVMIACELFWNGNLNAAQAGFSAVVNTIATVFLGRTGLIIALLFVIVLWLMLIIRARIGKKLVFLACGIAIAVIFLSLKENSTGRLAESIAWAFEWASAETRFGLGSSSVNELKDMIYVPQHTLDLFFGTGIFTGDGYRNSRSDSGYIRTILSVGLPLAIVLYLSIILLLHNAAESSRRFFLFYVITAFSFLIEFKEPFLYQNYYARAVILLVCAARLSGQRQEYNFSQRDILLN